MRGETGGEAAETERKSNKNINAYEDHQTNRSQSSRSRLPSLPRGRRRPLALNTIPAWAQAGGGTTFQFHRNLKTGISNSLAVIMMFGFVLGISSVIYGGFAIRRGDVDQGKMSIIGGAIIAAAPAVVYAFYKIFGLDTSSSVGVGIF